MFLITVSPRDVVELQKFTNSVKKSVHSCSLFLVCGSLNWKICTVKWMTHTAVKFELKEKKLAMVKPF